ncbi:SAF domain-containing protein [Bradyrhizobium sp. Leo121]|uniref:NAD(P)H-dependent oxidoreductase n=1 Tax=Bradyrhizobium sp. Leo121 TaxID=1571195 RepID=UPI001029AA07|nr:SAF domain-containing protein [Bradyrhizobium sp. Leo121]RZN30737.1 flagellar biosynthesis protein FlgA [Bradyrhizobium sp. Leo121]
MNFFKMLQTREANGRPIRVGLIGAGKFGSMYLAQVLKTPGVHLVGIADVAPARAIENLARVGWPSERHAAKSLDDALGNGTTHLTDDWRAVVARPEIGIIVECTGNPIAAIEHCLVAFEHGKDVINVTVEADAFCGPMLAKRAKASNVLYSLAYGDQPALTCELVDWARACGFPVVAAGRGHKWLPAYRKSTPETVWDHWGVTAEQAALGGMNPKMFNAFLDGSKPAIESAAIANATGLDAADDGLSFPPGSVDDIAALMRPKAEGGVLSRKGLVEVVSSLRPDGTPIPNDIRKGVWVSFEGDTEYIRRCFKEYQVITDPSGRYMSSYKKWHLIGLELGISVASIGLRREATGVATAFNADAVATAKRDLKAGEVLDGEGGYTVFGKLVPARKSLASGYLPLGLAHGIKLVRDIRSDEPIAWQDVSWDTKLPAFALRKELEATFARASAAE